MRPWAHGPVHRLQDSGDLFLTAATLGHKHYFRTDQRLALLASSLTEAAAATEYKLIAWIAFSNHYHAILRSNMGFEELPKLVQRIHGGTSRAVNLMDGTPGRNVWHQYWDTHLRQSKDYFSRLNYVLQNAVRHGLVNRPEDYPYSNAREFFAVAPRRERLTVQTFDAESVLMREDPAPIWVRNES